MTFNVRYDTETDGENAWEHRRSMVASVVRYHAPDVVGLQEPLAHQYDYLRGHLPAYAWEGVGRVDGVAEGEGEHCPLGWRDERITCERHGTVWLSETPDTPGSTYPNARKPRLVTWGRVAVDGRELVVCNTHFDHESERARIRSARQLRRLAGDLGGWEAGNGLATPVVLLGDFNCTRETKPYRTLTAVDDADGPRFDDAMAITTHPHHGPTATFERFSAEPNRKIDHVFVAGDVTVRQHAIIDDHWDGRPPSDHRPVVVELLL